MFKFFKFILYLCGLGFIALVAYAYIGEFFGADFSPPSDEIRQEIILENS